MSLAERGVCTPTVGLAGLLEDSAPGPAAPRKGPLLGALFESLVTLSVRTYAQACEAGVYHLRTRDGVHEVDLIVERDDQRAAAFEVKFAPSVTDADVVHLNDGTGLLRAWYLLGEPGDWGAVTPAAPPVIACSSVH